MSTLRTVGGLVAALVLGLTIAPVSALADSYYSDSYYNYGYCNTYQGYGYGSYPYDYSYYHNVCPRGTLFVYVQVNQNYNPNNRRAEDFTVSVHGGQVSRPSFPGSANGTLVYVNGSYSVSVSPFQGYTPSYSPGCNGTLANNSQASCYITLNPTNMPYPYYPTYPQYPTYPYPNYTNPTVYVTPTYIPSKLPNTGVDPNTVGAAALVVLVATALLSLPYVRKAFASILS